MALLVVCGWILGQVFWLLFESDLTPAGKNLLDGRYACFGYSTDVSQSSHSSIYICNCTLPKARHAGAHTFILLRSLVLYRMQGAQLLAGVKEGDVITSAKVIKGMENLKK